MKLSLGIVVAFSTSTVISLKTSVVARLPGPPQGWTTGRATTSLEKARSKVTLRIQLSQPRISEFHQLALRIATPGDELYGQHLSKEEADAFLSPRPESVHLVQEWLARHGLHGASEVGDAGDSIVVRASVANVEKLLETKYNRFYHQESGNVVLRTLQYSIPDMLRSHIDVVQPTTYFGMSPFRLAETAPSPPVSEVCNTTSPSCLSRTYNYGRALPYSNGRLGIAGFIGQYPSASDLSRFLGIYATQRNANQSFTCVSINGGSCPENQPGVEANLDTQIARAVTEKIPNVFYSTGGSPPTTNASVIDNEPYLEFLNALLSLPNADLPNSISISYGDKEFTVPDDYAIKCCDLFCKLGARGVSVLVSSGDNGVGPDCPGGIFTNEYPAACPWVTTVGGTTGVGPEKAWAGSGGGFSSLFSQPAYQADAVGDWLDKGDTHPGLDHFFNASGRAYPDVAALATRYPVVFRGETVSVGGTSASAPVVASIIQLLNSDRLQRGQKTLGFLNPWLYKRAAHTFTDVTGGSNRGCSDFNNGQGFQAVEGWDPVTGLGTPDFEKLLRVSRHT